MEDVVAVRITLKDGSSAAVMTWGRLFDAVDDGELLAAVRRSLSVFGIHDLETIAVCDSLQEVCNEKYFSETLIWFAARVSESRNDFAAWKSDRLEAVVAGKEMYLLGRDSTPSLLTRSTPQVR